MVIAARARTPAPRTLQAALTGGSRKGAGRGADGRQPGGLLAHFRQFYTCVPIGGSELLLAFSLSFSICLLLLLMAGQGQSAPPSQVVRSQAEPSSVLRSDRTDATRRTKQAGQGQSKRTIFPDSNCSGMSRNSRYRCVVGKSTLRALLGAIKYRSQALRCPCCWPAMRPRPRCRPASSLGSGSAGSLSRPNASDGGRSCFTGTNLATAAAQKP